MYIPKIPLRVFSTLLFFGVLSISPSSASDRSPAESEFPPLTLKQLKPIPEAATKRIHPSLRLLDQDGKNVLKSGAPLSLMRTCGGCHDTTYIAQNNYHAQVGLDEMHQPGKGPSQRAWDTGPGMFGRWSSLTYRVLSSRGNNQLDMGTAEWIMTMGPRHVGSGPAEFSRYSEKRLTDLVASDSVDPETHVVDPVSGNPRKWNWKASGILELNCLICHMNNPNNAARIEEIKKGQFRWASTATLVGTGLVKPALTGYIWLEKKFQPDGSIPSEMLMISDPKSANCRLCHAKTCRCPDPVIFENSLENWAAETTGEIFSPAKIFTSGMNLKDKSSLSRPWDVHAERLLGCVNCHYAMNNPQYNEKELAESKPRHLRFDSRRLSNNDYLKKPDHNLVKGHTAQGTVARRLDGSMRDCRDCHNAEATHVFLPYKSVHFEKLSCQTCHIPKIYSPARKITDWTVIYPDGSPAVDHRGVQGKINDPTSIIDGYYPTLLLHEELDGKYRLGPNNFITSWFWVAGNPERPLRLADLKMAFLTEKGEYHPEIVIALDENRSGDLSSHELRLDTEKKVMLIVAKLKKLGFDNPQIKGEIQPYTHSHSVVGGNFALRDCQVCHSENSRINQEVELAAYVPGGIIPEPVKDSHTKMLGTVQITQVGGLVFKPAIDPGEVYIHGTLRPLWIDMIGIAIVIGAIMGVIAHGALRILAVRKRTEG
ncbi:MAG: hypothetical protein PVI06_00020 [Desulfobacterales bacterium]|jgi:hypothetical protein